MRGRRVTIADVAEAVGVSVPTVSKVLNGRADVAPETRRRVERELETTGYRRRSSSTSSQLELVIHDIDTSWSLELIKGVEEVASAAGIGVVLTTLHGRHQPSQSWTEGVLLRRPIGVIMVMSVLADVQYELLAARSIPAVVVDTFGAPPAAVPTVGSNNWFGGLDATRHLLALGHRRIGMISGPDAMMCSRARVDGYRSAHDELDVPCDPQLVRWGNFEVSGGYEHARSLLSLPHPPTAIFAGSDHQAVGVMRAARELGLRVPEDLSIVGYDDLPFADWLAPRLTTVDQPLQQMAAEATIMLLDLHRGAVARSPRVDLATALVVRESTAPPGG
ncbi:LacI family transcriptional regulator [Salana multivorans]|uniref:LacI family transcriptional regulator n=1 Tax=Salana multivorans TaxID=120377 RepID=A0A3N2D9F2_9MICO|nr:LacI family DNA-binding transcriptional regulator [Salana multivorans]MBN8883894.1 LacI family DNA-binding transcriptional regulator [Salana multivorans]OJX97264.1 MAG: LacI family transcriptional regulator [Micrococcales bacterium 73-15]ROR96410.1 LacI family transcriptional regulator [Salana multivorans]